LTLRKKIERNGFALIPDVFDGARCDAICAALAAIDSAGVRRRGAVYAIRNLFEASAAVVALARSSAIRTLAAAVLGPSCFAVQAVLLDKIADANWKVPFHQDLYVPLAARPEIWICEGFPAGRRRPVLCMPGRRSKFSKRCSPCACSLTRAGK
jgi:hypothetical protein